MKTIKIQSSLFFSVWLDASRPKTLPAALAPVIMGTGLAIADQAFHFWSAIFAALGALLIQIGTNFANDYYDYKKGADDPSRLGPTRATAAGLVSPKAMRNAFILTFSLAAILGIYLIYRGGWPIVIIGAFSILSGIAYTGGPYPLGYNGLGDIFVLFFFGPIAVGGTYYVQTLDINMTVILLGLAPGLFSTAILTINNLRDIHQDTQSGKRTLAVRFGETFARIEYLFCIFGALAITAFFSMLHPKDFALLTFLVLLPAIPALKLVLYEPPGRIFNKVLAKTGQILFIYSLLFAVGWNL